MSLRTIAFLVLCVLSTAPTASSHAEPLSRDDYDRYNGREINEVCAGCHGEFGEGGKDGEYPRLAGQAAEFTAKQLVLFRDRRRPNMAMIEYVDDRQMPDSDIADISIYLEQIELVTKLPPIDENSPDFNAYNRLIEAKSIMQIPRAEGDTERGAKIYNKECRSCHGTDGWGDRAKAVPMLAGQYTNYLWRQVKKYRNKIRIHDDEDPEGEILNEFSDEELRDVFAYLSIVDD